MTLKDSFFYSLSLAIMLGASFAGNAAAQDPGLASGPAPELRFQDFFRSPTGPRGLEISDTLRRADGHSVTQTGYMVQQEMPAVGHFMLTPRPVQMSEHADGDADDLPTATVLVYLDPTQKDWVVTYARGLVALTGQLTVGRHEGPDGRIAWVRLQLGPNAARVMSMVEQAFYQHNLQHKH